MRVAFDTNVVLDAIMARPDAKAAIRLLRAVAEEKIEGAITVNTITDIYCVARKKIGDKKARDAIFELLSIFDVTSVDGSVCIDALSLPMTDYEDAVMAVCADRDGAGYIVTRDADFVEAGMNNGCSAVVMYPTDVLELFEQSK